MKSEVPPFLKRAPGLRGFAAEHLNFYRIHMAAFIVIPLVFSAIFYASNGEEYPHPYIDCLFVCVSAMTVTGLSTLNLSTITQWQRAILFFLMCIGNTVESRIAAPGHSAVSVLMVLIRRHFFQLKFEAVVRNNPKSRQRAVEVELEEQRLKGKRRIFQFLKDQLGVGGVPGRDGKVGGSYPSTPSSSRSLDPDTEHGLPEAAMPAEEGMTPASRVGKRPRAGKQGKRGKIRKDMVRRLETPAVLVNPMGAISSKSNQETAQRQLDRQAAEARLAREREVATSMAMDTEVGEQGASAPAPPYGGTGREGEEAIPSGSSPDEDARERSEGFPQLGLGSSQPAPSRSSVSSLPRSPKQADLGLQLPPKRERPTSPDGVAPPTIEIEEEDTRRTEADPGTARSRLHSAVEPPSGGILLGRAETFVRESREGRTPHFAEVTEAFRSRQHRRRGSEPGSDEFRKGDGSASGPSPQGDPFPRSQTVEFVEPPHVDSRPALTTHGSMRYRGVGNADVNMERTLSGQRPSMTSRPQHSSRSGPGVPLSRTMTSSKSRGYGGWPTPFAMIGFVVRRVFPKVQRRFARTLTVPHTSTYTSVVSGGGGSTSGETSSRPAPYISFDATVSRNSVFHALTEAQREELGGVEYRALDMLSTLIPTYWLGVNLFCVLLVAPWLTHARNAEKYRRALDEQSGYHVDPTWFWFFNVVSAYTNTGMSLFDQSMVPFQDAYLMIFVLSFLILAGNTAFPVFLRFFIWVLSKCVPTRSRAYETFRFLLDHPRRCFVYLFPSVQTWFLFTVIIMLTLTDWVSFLVLDIGTPVIEDIPVGTRVADGVLQSVAVRAAGFQIVPLSALAPAVQVLYVIMMYVSVYPIALSVRSTNVYEERSLGIFAEPINDDDDEPVHSSKTGDKAKLWGNYLASHARKQLAFDIWWLGFALWLVCIVERHNIKDRESDYWFNVFTILFELTSAYGTVGLSLGVPYDNFSLSGAFRTLSKLIVMMVMIRGRHRGLPVAIDRAVLLPGEVEAEDADDRSTYRQRSRSMSSAPAYDEEYGVVDDDNTDAYSRMGSASGEQAEGTAFSRVVPGKSRKGDLEAEVETSERPVSRDHLFRPLSQTVSRTTARTDGSADVSRKGGGDGGQQLVEMKERSGEGSDSKKKERDGRRASQSATVEKKPRLEGHGAGEETPTSSDSTGR